MVSQKDKIRMDKEFASIDGGIVCGYIYTAYMPRKIEGIKIRDKDGHIYIVGHGGSEISWLEIYKEGDAPLF